jgi:hypothetical protein
MSAAIITRYHGPTNTKGARISARMATARPVFIPYAYECSERDAHAAAAAALMAREGWPVGCPLAVGGMPDGGYVFVRENDRWRAALVAARTLLTREGASKRALDVIEAALK